MKRNYTASKGEGAGENKKYFSQQERDKASSHKIGARASLAEKPPITEAEVKSKPLHCSGAGQRADQERECTSTTTATKKRDMTMSQERKEIT